MDSRKDGRVGDPSGHRPAAYLVCKQRKALLIPSRSEVPSLGREKFGWVGLLAFVSREKISDPSRGGCLLALADLDNGLSARN